MVRLREVFAGPVAGGKLQRSGLDWKAGVALGGIVIVSALIAGLQPDRPAPANPAQTPQLSDAAVVQCRKLLASATTAGLILERPSPERINVDERLWAELDATTKERTMQAVACVLWRQAMPPDDGHVVAYGAHSGKRIWLLSSAGMLRE